MFGLTPDYGWVSLLAYDKAHLVYKVVIILHRMDVQPHYHFSFLHLVVPPVSILKVHCLLFDPVLVTQEPNAVPSGVRVVGTEPIGAD